jgi:hypothetical protein
MKLSKNMSINCEEDEIINWEAVDESNRYIMESEWMLERPPAILAAFEEYPPWYFYKTLSGSIKRIYGFIEDQDGAVRAHTVTAMAIYANDTIGGTPLEDLIRVYAWSDQDLIRIELCNAAEGFTTVDGWKMFLHN